MLVYTRNRCFRLPWCSKINENRPFVPVINGKILKDSTPDLKLLQQVLVNLVPASIKPYTYPITQLEQRSHQKEDEKVSGTEMMAKQFFQFCKNKDFYPPKTFLSNDNEAERVVKTISNATFKAFMGSCE